MPDPLTLARALRDQPTQTPEQRALLGQAAAALETLAGLLSSARVLAEAAQDLHQHAPADLGQGGAAEEALAWLRSGSVQRGAETLLALSAPDAPLTQELQAHWTSGFLRGAKWHSGLTESGTMWQSEQNAAYAAAAELWPVRAAERLHDARLITQAQRP